MAYISMITLGVVSIDRSQAFYASLGWHRSPASVTGEVAFLSGQHIALALYSVDALRQDAAIAHAHALTPTGNCAFAVNVPDMAAVDALLNRVLAAGGTISRPAQRTTWGGYNGYFLDPDGHLWEVAYNPGFALDPAGQITLP